jgi:hypothetical protein
VQDDVKVALGDGRAYVLSVLERHDTEGVVLSAPGSVTIKSSEGGVRLAAAGDVDVVSHTGVSIAAPRFELTSNVGEVAFRTLAFVGEKVGTSAEQIKSVAKTVETLMKRFIQRTQLSYRFVEELDPLQAEAVDHTAKTTYSVSAKNAGVFSEQVIKLDASNIQLG